MSHSTIICVTDEEPQCFHPTCTRGFAVRLSVKSDADDEIAAQADIEHFLAKVVDIRFGAFSYANDALTKIVAPLEPVSRMPDTGATRNDFKDWLRQRGAEQLAKPDNTGYFYRAAPSSPSGKIVTVTEKTVHAEHVLRAAASWTAPAPQLLQLAFTLRLDAQETGPVVFLPYFDAAPPQDTYALDALPPGEPSRAPGDSISLSGYLPDSPQWNCLTTLTKPPRLDSTEIDPETGFLKMASGSEEGHRALKRIEERGGSLFTGYFGVRELCSDVRWPNEQDEAARERAAKLFAWGAVASMATSLDTVLIALRMPGREARDGALLAPFLDIIENIFNSSAYAQQPRLSRKDTRKAVRAALAMALPALPADANDGERAEFVARLKLLCGIGSNGDWFDALIAAYIAPSATTWTAVTTLADKLIKEHRGASRQRAPAAALDQALVVLQENVTSEAGVEKTVNILLSLDAVRNAWVDAMVDAGASAANLSQLFKDAAAQFTTRLQNDVNGAEAARHAVGSLLADLLALATQEKTRGLPDQLSKAFTAWDFWRRRFALNTTAPDDNLTALLDVLAHPLGDLKAYVGGQMDQFVFADQMQQSVRDELFPPENARFLPDHAPEPVAVRLCIDPAADDDDDQVDDFSATMAGVALLVQRSPGPDGMDDWAHANLAQLTAGNAVPLEPFGIQALPTTIVDARRNMYVLYDGLPVATSAFDDTLTRTAIPEWQRFLLSDYPEDHPGYAPTPALAYGTRVEIAAHVVGRAGSLPFQLQANGMKPWEPAPNVQFEREKDDKNFVASLPYARRTAIGRTVIKVQGHGGVPAGVQPLAIDYPRIGMVSGGDQFLDMHRNGDGSGTIALPTEPETTTQLVLRALRYTGEDAAGTLHIGLCNTPSAIDPVAGSVALPVAPGPDRNVVVTLTRNDTVDGQWQLSATDGEQDGTVNITLTKPSPAWIRLQFEDGAQAALSLADPSGETASHDETARPVPDNLVLLGAPMDSHSSLWMAPFDRPTATAHMDWPRVGYLDFMRWCANDTLRAELYQGLDEIQISAFELLLLAAYIGRTNDAGLAEMLERLPDPAVSGMRLDLYATDSLVETPDQDSTPQSLIPTSLPLVVPKLATVIAANMAAIDARKIKVVLAAIDQHFRQNMTLTAGKQHETQDLSLKLKNNIAAVTIPAGCVARLAARPVVASALFDGDTPVINPRLREWATAIDKKGALVFFNGASLQIETMIGPLAGAEDRPWRLSRARWSELVHSDLIEHQCEELTRQYRLRSVPNKACWQWRQLASIDIATQRWRFSGRPIYSWFRPRAMARALRANHASMEIVPTDESNAQTFRAFEQEAFQERDPRDAEVETTPLLPAPAVTTLASVTWDQADATMFRHRFTLRSRYAGAMRAEATGQCEAWAENQPDYAPHAWRRVVMLADRSHLQLTRPQLRALLPLTASPEKQSGATPPIMCVLQEAPFCNGGLAARICAEVRTGIGYEIKAIEQPAKDGDGVQKEIKHVALPRDIRKELGPDPRLSYLPFPAARARGAALAAEGPIGLTFDRDIGQGVAFPNTALMLAAEIPGRKSAQVLALDEHFLSVGLLRYLDPDWLIDDPAQPVATQKGIISASFAAAWWISFPECAGSIDVGDMSSDDATPVSRWLSEKNELVARIRMKVLDDTVTTEEELDLCSITEDVVGQGALAFLHTPLDDRRAGLSAFFVPDMAATQRRGAGNAPVLLGSIEWSVSKNAGATHLLITGTGATVRSVNASASTALQWTRTGRNFDTVLCQRGAAPAATGPVGVADLSATRHGAELELYVTKDDNHEPAWIRTSQGTKPFPVHVQRHIAVLPSHLQSTVGLPIDIPMPAQMAPARIIALPGTQRVDNLRMVEFETPAIIIGHSPDGALPAHHSEGYIDLHAIGFDQLGMDLKSGVDLSFYARLVAAKDTLGGLASIAIELQSQFSEKVRMDLRRTPGMAAHAFCFDVRVSDLGVATGFDCYAIDIAGAIEQGSGIFVDLTSDVSLDEWQVLPKPANGSASAQGLRVKLINAVFADNQDHEIWMELSLLASPTATRRKGFMHEVDFDWFFGNSMAGVSEAITPHSLASMREAQGRILSVSQPIKVTSI